MSHHGLQVLYTLMNDGPDWACERAFTPWLDFEASCCASTAAALQPGDVHAAARVRRDRLQPAVRGLLHQHPDDARPGRHPAAQQRPRRSTIRWSSPAGRGAEPRAARAVRRPVRHRRRRGEPAAGCGQVDGAEGRVRRGSRRRATTQVAGSATRSMLAELVGGCRWPTCRGSTSRSITPTARFVGHEPHAHRRAGDDRAAR